MFEHHTEKHHSEKPYSGAEAAVAVAEPGLASWRAAKLAWLEAAATLRAPESASASTSYRPRA